MNSKTANTFLCGLATLLSGLAPTRGQPTIPPSQIPAAAVNTNTLGWTVRTVLISTDEKGSGWMNSAARMELALGPVTKTPGGLPSAGQVIDDNTGDYCTNAANFLGGNNPHIQDLLTEQFGTALGGCVVPADTNGYWTLNADDFTYAYINCDGNAGPSDFTGPFKAPSFPKNYFPGIPGNTVANNWVDFAVSFMGYVYLNAGTTIFNVNSDDGFILFISPSSNPNDAASQVRVGEYDFPRGASTTTMPVNVLQAGWYSVRLDYFQNTSPTSCTFFTKDAGGNDVLINDTSSPTSLMAYPTPEVFPELYVIALSPTNGATDLPPASPPSVSVEIQDGIETRVDSTKPVTITMNGTALTGIVISNMPSTTPSGLPLGKLTTISAALPSGLTLPGFSTIPIEVDFTDSSGHATNIRWSFTTSGLALQNANATINTNLPGFIVYPFQEEGQASNDVLGQSEEQILGLGGPNGAVLVNWLNSENGVSGSAIPGPQGLYFIETNYINWNVARNALGGDFDINNGYPPNEFPGVISGGYPGEAGLITNSQNFQMLVETWLYFPAPGNYLLGVNCTDGFSLRSGVAPADVFGTLLGEFEGSREAADTRIPILAAQGFYPMRLLFEHGGGGAGFEFYSFSDNTSNAAHQLINDSTNSIKAYYSAAFYSPCIGAVCPPIGRSGLDASTPLVVQLVDGMTDGKPDIVASVHIYTNGTLVTGLTPIKANGGTTIRLGSPPTPTFPSGTNRVMVVYTDSNSVIYTNSWSFSLAAPATAALMFGPPVISGNQVTISWTGGGTLQEAVRLTGQASDWSDVPGVAGDSYSVTINSTANLFFRLRQ